MGLVFFNGLLNQAVETRTAFERLVEHESQLRHAATEAYAVLEPVAQETGGVIERLGGQTAVARSLTEKTGLNISQQRIGYMINTGRINPELVPYIVEELDDPEVTFSTLNPYFPWEKLCRVACKGAAA